MWVYHYSGPGKTVNENHDKSFLLRSCLCVCVHPLMQLIIVLWCYTFLSASSVWYVGQCIHQTHGLDMWRMQFPLACSQNSEWCSGGTPVVARFVTTACFVTNEVVTNRAGIVPFSLAYLYIWYCVCVLCRGWGWRYLHTCVCFDDPQMGTADMEILRTQCFQAHSFKKWCTFGAFYAPYKF